MLFRSNAALSIFSSLSGNSSELARRFAWRNVVVALLPLLTVAAILGTTWHFVTVPDAVQSTAGLQEMGSGGIGESRPAETGGLQEPPQPGGLQEPPKELGALQEPPREPGALQEPPQAAGGVQAPSAADQAASKKLADAKPADQPRLPMPSWLWWMIGVGLLITAAFYWVFNLIRLEIFKMLLGSFFPLAVLILFVLGAIVFGWATPTEAAAIGSLGGFLLAVAYRFQAKWQALGTGAPARARDSAASAVRDLGPILKESSFLTAKTSAMVCWLFVGSSIFSAAFALLGGQELIEKWVLSMNLTALQFMVLSQVIIFLLGWPLEWTEIIVIFMPIFIPLLPHFQIDPLFFGLLVALNLQTAFLSPPVAMAAFYLKGVSPPHVTLNQIFLGMMPFMGIQVIAVLLLYMFPDIGMWLPRVLYK